MTDTLRLKLSADKVLLELVSKEVPKEDILTDQIVWHNLEIADELVSKNVYTYNLSYSALINSAALAYFALYPDRSPAELELELRDRGFQSGLIAVNWREDSTFSEMVRNGKAAIRSSSNLTKWDEENDNPMLDYFVLFSLRSRLAVVKETLHHAESMEQNLNRLEEAGLMTISDENQHLKQEKLGIAKASKDRKKVAMPRQNIKMQDKWKSYLKSKDTKVDDDISPNDSELLHKLQAGAIRLYFRPVDMEAEWIHSLRHIPNATILQIGRFHSLKVLILVREDGEPVCPYAAFVLERAPGTFQIHKLGRLDSLNL